MTIKVFVRWIFRYAQSTINRIAIIINRIAIIATINRIAIIATIDRIAIITPVCMSCTDVAPLRPVGAILSQSTVQAVWLQTL